MSTLLSERPQPITEPKLWDQVPAQGATPRALAEPRPAAAAPARQIETPLASPFLDLVVAILREWRRRRAERHELASLDERMIRDVGLDPGTVYYEASQSFWRPPRDWRS